MSYPVVVRWEPVTGNTAAISSLQDYPGAGNLILNSNVSNSSISYYGPYIYNKVIRTVSFTSVNNLSGVTITINGLGSAVDANGNPTQSLGTSITETLAGPNANTVNTVHIFKQIDSISINGAAAGLSAGFGPSGICEYILVDYNRVGWYASYQTAIYNRTTLTHTVYITLTKPEVPTYEGNLKPYPEVIPAFEIGTVDSTVNQLLNTAYPIVMCWATIKATSGETFYFTALEQGIR